MEKKGGRKMAGKKFSILLYCFIAFLLVMTGCSSNSSSGGSETTNSERGDSETENQESITLKFATAQPAGSNVTKLISEPFMNRIEELTDGQVEIEFYPAEQLGKAADLLNLTADGVTDLAYYAPTYTPDKMPLSASLMAMPGTIQSSYQGSVTFYNLSQQSPMLETDFLKNGVRPVLGFTTPTYDFFTSEKEIKVPEDIKGMKIRSAGGVLNAALDFAGANPVQLGMPDTYQGFQTGVIDASHMDAITLTDFGLDEVTSYTTRGLDFSVAAVGFIINEEVFQSLPENVQKAIIQAGEEVTKSAGEAYDALIDTTYDELAAAGVTVYEVSAEEKAQWQELYSQFNESWINEQNSEEFNEVYQQFVEELEKHK